MLNTRHLLIILGLTLLHFTQAFSQQFYRIKADFSIKENKPDGQSQLIMGQVYYDKIYKKIIYDITFPEKGVLIVTDTVIYRIENNKVISKTPTGNLNDFSVFHLSLNGDLINFGLNNSPYTIGTIEKKENLVISTWIPPKKYAHLLGKTIISQKDKRLFGLVFFTPTEEIIGKQFFRKYINTNGLEFPSELVQVTYFDNKEFYKITTFKNIIIDEFKNENLYNYNLPD
ncbi:MAG: hypothetical protein H0V01_01590 [Bacteroidetes bacterium]|nr:hypothetical protein [Bacteroidota bacterium]HET6243234.1 hypothetical protein [Bacteroidia bacterium]